jgi:superfamily II RNA helicase
MKYQLDTDQRSLEYTQNYIANQTEQICSALQEFGFIHSDDKCEYGLTELGIIASNIAEIHPLIISKLLIKWNYFSEFTALQLVGLFSCFTDVKVQSECRSTIPNTEDSFLCAHIKEVNQMYNEYAEFETEKQIITGIHYDDALQFDIIDFSMKWCECTTIEECKLFIQTDLYEKSISIGDFTKAMLKVVTITKEWMNVFEIIGNIEALHKFTEIEGHVLKYIATSQSLYV